MGIWDNAAYKLGKADRMEGVASGNNPYVCGTFKHKSWEAGWADKDQVMAELVRCPGKPNCEIDYPNCTHMETHLSGPACRLKSFGCLACTKDHPDYDSYGFPSSRLPDLDVDNYDMYRAVCKWTNYYHNLNHHGIPIPSCHPQPPFLPTKQSYFHLTEKPDGH